jgi:hypothetical protein
MLLWFLQQEHMFRSGLWHGQQCSSAWLPRVQVSACRIHGVLSRCWLLQASSIFVETFSYVHFLGTVLQVLHGPQQPLRCATSSLSGGADIRNLKIFSHCLDSMNQSTFLFLGIPSPSRAPHCCGGLHKPSTQLRCISSLSAVWVMSPQI